MTARDGRTERAARLVARRQVAAGEELRAARVASGLSLATVGAACGMSPSKVGRIERSIAPAVSIADLAVLGAVVGLDLSVKFYPGPLPVRDAGHAGVLGRFSNRLHADLAFRTEVRVGPVGDQ